MCEECCGIPWQTARPEGCRRSRRKRGALPCGRGPFVCPWQPAHRKTPGLAGGFVVSEKRSSVDLLAGVADAHLGPQMVHLLHDMDGLGVGHGGAFQQPALDAVHRLQHLVLIAGELGGAGEAVDQMVVGVVDPQALGVVDVFHHHIAIGAVDHAVPVGHRIGGGGEVGHPAVLPGEGDAVGQIHPVLIFGAQAVDGVGAAEHHLGKVQGVDPHVQQGAAGQLGHHNPVVAGDEVAQIGGEEPGLPDEAGGQGLLDHPAHGLVAGPDGLGDQHPLAAGIADGVRRLAGADGEGLFAQDVLAVVGAELDVAVMVGVGGGDVDQVQVRVAEHGLVAAKGFLHPVGLGKGLGPGQIPRPDGVELHLGVAVLVEQGDGAGHNLGNLPGAQNSDFHGSLPPVGCWLFRRDADADCTPPVYHAPGRLAMRSPGAVIGDGQGLPTAPAAGPWPGFPGGRHSFC